MLNGMNWSIIGVASLALVCMGTFAGVSYSNLREAKSDLHLEILGHNSDIRIAKSQKEAADRALDELKDQKHVNSVYKAALIKAEDELAEYKEMAESSNEVESIVATIKEVNPRYSTSEAREMAKIIIEQSKRYKVPSLVITGILATESAFQSAAENEYTEIIGSEDEAGGITEQRRVNRTVYGMGQISWHYWGDLLEKEGIAKTPYELQSNDIKSIAATCRVFRQFVIKNNGNLILALCGYSGHSMLDGMDYIESVMRWGI